jgi:pentatricopeptide repeat protein
MQTYEKKGGFGARELQNALELLVELQEWGIKPNEYTYRKTIMLCEVARAGRRTLTRGRWKEALELLEEMKQWGVEPSRHIYHTLMRLCRNRDKWQALLEVLEEMKDAGIEQDSWTYNLNILALQKSGFRGDTLRDKVLVLRSEMQAKGIEPMTQKAYKEE